ncbi:hypothetical protein [Vibrio phage 2 TSL-2019]|uniref:Uncharacterized protein n=1 Tax=Vibrio phage 2 TSL-2019 TaxID=2508172 RepID=A0A513PWC6_9CAUD|nr:hypothetical protein HWC03_gp101 [Vibrio phage 2 TSL-2019]QAU04256.1 hypothetical protein [Vibrio phage 2 TSL-2019]
MLETQLELYKKTIEEANQFSEHTPTGKYFQVLDYEVLITATKISVTGKDDLPELEMDDLQPMERELLSAITSVFEGPYLDAASLLPEGIPFRHAWVVGDYIFGFTFNKIR